MKRRFVVLASSIEEMQHAIPHLARCVSAALMVSHGLRRDADLLLHSLNDGFTVHLVTEQLRGVRPDEASTLGILAKAFRAAGALGDRPKSVHSGVIACRRSLRTYFAQFPARFLCSSQGLDLKSALSSCQATLFIVPLSPGLHVEGVERLKCPVDDLLPDQIISLLNIYLDRCCK